jgi:hypothetical protein
MYIFHAVLQVREQVSVIKLYLISCSYKKGVWCLMANDRAITAESISSILDLARIRRQSGRLKVEQVAGGRLQEGEIYLQAGQPVYVRLGQWHGQEALDRLLAWRNVQFTLQLDEQGTAPMALSLNHSNGTTPSSLPAQPAPAPAPRPERTTTGDLARASSNAPGLEWLVPQKRDVGRDVLSLPLTRRQRFIYFLVDGQRSMSDLSRCTGKTIQEIELILKELQAQGLVNI